MKSKRKLMLAIAAVTLGATSSIALASCHHHEYGEWKQTTAPTCTDKGEETRECSCGEKETREVAAAGHDYEWTVTDPTCEGDGERKGECKNCEATTEEKISATGHEYGEWEIEKPTELKAGLAVKVCETDGKHKFEVELPALTKEGTGYKSATQDKNTKLRTYVIATDEGDVSFETYAAFNLQEAIEIGVANMSNVASGEIVKDNIMGGKDKKSSVLTFEKGDNYLHVKDEGLLTADAGGAEFFISKLADGSYFYPYRTVGVGTGYVDMDDPDYLSIVEQIKEISDKAANGSNSEKVEASKKILELTGALYDQIADGNEVAPENLSAENLLSGIPYLLLYAEHPALAGNNFHGIEKLVSTMYSVGKTNPNGDFTEDVSEPDENGVRTYSFSFGYLGLTEMGYYREYKVSFKIDANFVMSEAVVENKGYSNKYSSNSYVVDSNGYAKVSANAKAMYTQTFNVTQNEFEEGAVKPVNPYKPEDLIASDFELSIAEIKTIFDGGDYTITGIKTVRELGDELELEAGQSLCLRISNISPETTNFNFDTIKFYLRTSEGDVELQGNYEGGDDGHIKAVFNQGDMLLGLSCWVAGDLQLVIKTDRIEKVITLHVPFQAPTGFGTSVYQYDEVTEKENWETVQKDFNIYTGQTFMFTNKVDHPAYQDSGYTVTVRNEKNEDITSNVITDGFKEGVPVKLFKSLEAGKYTITLTTTFQGASDSATLTLNVEEAPEISDILNGNYKNEEEEISVEFTPASEGALNGTATIKKGEEQETVVNYVYDADEKTFRVEYVSGPDEIEYSFNISSSYYLYLTYDSEYGYAQNILLTKDGEIIDTLSGEYNLTGSRMFLPASATGVYTITASANDYIFFKTSATAQTNVAGTVEFALAKGDEVEVWSIMGTGKFTIAYKGAPVKVTGVTLKDKEKVFIGASVTLTPEFTPADASIKTGTWSTSNKDIAKVENGVVTGVNAGTVTIRFVSSDGKFEAQCKITVEEVVLGAGVTDVVTVNGNNFFKFKGEANAKYAITNDLGFYMYGADADGNINYGNAGYTLVVTTDADGIAYLCINSVRYGEWDLKVTAIKAVSADGITVDLESKEMSYGESFDITEHVTITPGDASDKTFKITSSDSSVVEVDEWNPASIKAVGAGTATITVTANDGGFTATFEVTVTINEITAGDNQLTVSEGGNYLLFTGGEAGKEYVFTGNFDGLGAIKDGNVDWENYSTEGTLTLTADSEGKIWVYVYSDSAGTKNLNVALSQGTVTPDPDPEPDPDPAENTITVSDGYGYYILSSLGTEGASFTLDGCVEDKIYSVSALDENDEIISGVTIYVGIDRGNPVEFVYSVGIRSINVECAENLTNVTILVEEVDNGGENPGGGLTLGETYTTTYDDTVNGLELEITEAGNYIVTIVDAEGSYSVGEYTINGETGNNDNNGEAVTKTLSLQAGDKIIIKINFEGLNVTVTKA